MGCLRMMIKQVKEKKFYKEKTMLRVNTEEELEALHQEHDHYIGKKPGGKKK
jgi:hypothetical protein